jgi:predicted SnoaL-like aldol condensation-catalyzing enzyme
MSNKALEAANKALVIEATTRVFLTRDVTVAMELFHPHYRQHNPAFPDGNEGMADIIRSLSEDFTYERGLVLAEGDFVTVHCRVVGWAPKPMVAIDIFRIEDGKIAEHWDVVQEEVPASETVSGRPMFESVR